MQHGCGLLRCLLRLWAWSYRRLVQHAAFRRMFLQGLDSRKILQGIMPDTIRQQWQCQSTPAAATATAPSTAATTLPTAAAAAAAMPSVALLPLPSSISHSIAIVPLLSSSSSSSGGSSVANAGSAAVGVGASVGVDVDVEDDDAFLPPGSESTFSSRLAHMSYTMYRARQVLRLGRWLYDIPDVRDSALELWYGVTEHKSAEEQEAEEEWEEHERVHVVRSSTSRRASFDANAHTNNNPIVRDGRGTFTFPLSARTPQPSSTHVQTLALSSASTPHSRSGSGPGSGAGSTDALASLRSTAAATPPPLPPTTVAAESSAVMAAIPSDNAAAASSASSSAADDAGASKEAEDEEEKEAEEEEADDEEAMTMLEYTVGVIDLTNSVMGLLIDAADDAEFLSSLGALPPRVGELSGTLSSYLWLVSGGIDVAMCAWKLWEYRAEMRDTIEQHKLALLEQQRAAQQQQQQQQAQITSAAAAAAAAAAMCSSCCCMLHHAPSGMLSAVHGVSCWCSPASSPSMPDLLLATSSSSPPSSASASTLSLAPASSSCPSPSSSATATAAAVAASTAVATVAPLTSSSVVAAPAPPAQPQLPAPAPAPVLAPLSLCSGSCDVDCVHIESLRFFRYIGELGLSVCGVLELRGVRLGDPRLEALMEASGLLSALATFLKRAATHARSKSVVQRAESNIFNMQQQQTRDEAATQAALYS